MIEVRDGDVVLTLRALDWDSAQLGIPCGLLDVAGGGPLLAGARFSALLGSLLAQARQQGFVFLTAKPDAGLRGFVEASCAHGAGLIDTELTFHKVRDTPRGAALRPAPAAVSALKVERYWHEGLLRIADALPCSRFFRDPRLPPEAARKLWRESIRNHCTGRASYSLICRAGEEPVGLLTALEKDGTSDIFLVGVVPERQHQGIGAHLMERYEALLADTVREQVVETQLHNFRAQRLYAALGYRAVRARHVLHFWLGGGAGS